MKISDSLSTTVKNSLLCGYADPSTFEILQSLLVVAPTDCNDAPILPSSRTVKSRNTSATTKSQKSIADKKLNLILPDEETRCLSAKSRYALATEVVNISLKTLTAAAKPLSKTRKASNSSRQARDSSKSSNDHELGQRPLQLRCSNSTPSRNLPEPKHEKAVTKSHILDRNLVASEDSIFHTAECARLAFSYLRSVDEKKLGVRELPKLQIEVGMLSLCGKLIILGLFDAVSKELRALRARLEIICKGVEGSKSQIVLAVQRKGGQLETPADLLLMNIDSKADPDALTLIVNYQIQILQLMAVSPDSAAIEDVLPLLLPEKQGSPGYNILQLAKNGGDNVKTIKHLEMLSQAVLRLCPSVPDNSDKVSRNAGQQSSLVTVFSFQVLSLKIRRETWEAMKRHVDVEKEIMEPLSKFMNALVRRVPIGKLSHVLFKACYAACEGLGISLAHNAASGGTSLKILRILSLLAEGASLFDQALGFANQALKQLDGYRRDDARWLSAVARKCSASLRVPSGRNDDSGLSDIEYLCEALGKPVTGSTYDGEVLLKELIRLTSVIEPHETDTRCYDSLVKLALTAAAYASRFSRLHNDKSVESIHELICQGLSKSGSNDVQTSWVTVDTAHALIKQGVLQRVAEESDSRPMAHAWASSQPAIALGRILKVLILKSLALDTNGCMDLLVDDRQLDARQRGALLERQLKCLLDVSNKARHRALISTLVPEVLMRLAQTYTETTFPLRLSRIATLALQVHEELPDIIPPHLISTFATTSPIDENSLQGDLDLKTYACDIQSSFNLSIAFFKRSPTHAEIENVLRPWHDILENAKDGADIHQVVDSPSTLLAQFASIDAYFDMLGDDHARLMVLQLVIGFSRRFASVEHQLSGFQKMARAFISLAQAEKALLACMRTKELMAINSPSSLQRLDYNILLAECLICLGRRDQCQDALEEASKLQQEIISEDSHSSRSGQYKLIYARGCLMQSKYLQEKGLHGESLTWAKRAAMIMNTTWSGLERDEVQTKACHADSDIELEVSSVQMLAIKVSKLELKPDAEEIRSHRNSKGAVFWPLVRLICATLIHLADLYVHHGIFHEADHASQQALKIAASTGSHIMKARVRFHRCHLLNLAGRVDDAELILAQESGPIDKNMPLIRIEGLRARAFTSLKHGELETSYALLQEAETCIKDDLSMQSDLAEQLISTCGPTIQSHSDETRNTTKSGRNTKCARITRTVSASKPAGKTRVAVRKTESKAGRSTRPADALSKPGHMLQQLEATLSLDKAIIGLKLGLGEGLQTDKVSLNTARRFQESQLEYDCTMKKMEDVLQSDFAWNVLPESTLAHPSLKGRIERPSNSAQEDKSIDSSTLKQLNSSKRTLKGHKQKTDIQNSIESLLTAANRSLMADSEASLSLTTAEFHRQYSQLTNVAMLLSATCAADSCNMPDLLREAMAIERARMRASECQRAVIRMDKEVAARQNPTVWPKVTEASFEFTSTVENFQADYIDIIPPSWSAVSICLSETCDELYIARYRCSQAPFILRLPFSRQEPDEAGDKFDFRMGRAELRDIIELSNYSCHSYGGGEGVAGKGAKSKWWAEREALDRRLQELLFNMESMWLGGFRGLFAQQSKDEDQVDRFRKAFDAILDRHLPSRKTTKRECNRLELDNQILELFLGLAGEVGGDTDTDIDEALADLLYFVVDVFQFSGERNAYDEVDFDSIAIEVMDALRDYGDTLVEHKDQDGHLILVLDRRLQAFPWESLPCLETTNVSRLDSMFSLRERILEMGRQSTSNDAQYHVSRKSGTYILNPSSDLKGTETMLGPELTKVNETDSNWTAIVRREPSEQEFVEALSTSPTMLYFGHGAGLQYIRPRTIRRLDSCSDVVWLMGCSSGAVTEYDELEPFVVPLTYLAAGQSDRRPEKDSSSCQETVSNRKCMAVVATLWDVTDKDIDRFSLAVGDEWGLWKCSPDATKAPVKRSKPQQNADAPCTPEKTAKTPKTPKVRKTPAPVRTPARSRTRARQSDERKQSLVEAVTKSRDACYLRYLNGAAAVVYGVPVYLHD